MPPKYSKGTVRAQRLAIWDKFSFSLRIVPLIIHMNHFSYSQIVVQINIFEEPQNIFSQPKSQTPNYRASPSIFNYRVPPGSSVHAIFSWAAM